MGMTFANKVTIGRIIAVPFFIGTIMYYVPQRDYLRVVALWIFIFAVFLDVVDGYIARTRHQKTAAGAILDPLADKILITSAFICLFRIGVYFQTVRFPIWFVVGVISRDVILIIGSLLIYMTNGRLDVEPSRWGKATTFFQVLSVIGILLQWKWSPWIWYITITLTIISGLGYLKDGVKLLNTNGNGTRHGTI